jgi:hypothetical protein
MSRNKKELWTLENGERFTIAGKHYTFVGKYNTGFRFRCFAVDDVSLNIEEFDGNTELYTKKVKKRNNFWYKKKFLTLVCRHIEPDRIEVRFSDLCSRLFGVINKYGGGMIDELGGKSCSHCEYIISVDYKHWKGITIMLINTVTGKSVAVRHINPEKVTIDNVQLILFELYKKYMNQ